MGYMHIDNLYRDNRIFAFDECYALEKIHGTSAHITFKSVDGNIQMSLFSGGENSTRFAELFDFEELKQRLIEFPIVSGSQITFYGEAYGGKQQGMSATYGPNLKFVVFDVKVDEEWLCVPDAERAANLMGLEFVDYNRIFTKLSLIDEERSRPSRQAVRNGVVGDKEREGIVLRPLVEATDHRGNRIITKHKNDSFKETKTQRQVDPDKLVVLAEANKIADEWVTDMRLRHVIDRALQLKNQNNHDSGLPETFDLYIEDTGIIIGLMLEDVKREAKGEIVESKDAMRAIGSATARLFKKRLSSQLTSNLTGDNRG